jgi:anti-sigma B factor antagonist
MPAENLEIRTAGIPEGDLVQLSGALTQETMHPLQVLIREQSKAPWLVLDMTDLEYMDSAGLGLLVNAHVSTTKNSRKLLLVGVPERVDHLLEITKVSGLFLRVETLNQAQEIVERAGEA